MPFAPAPITSPSRRASGNQLTWAVRQDKGRLRLMIGAKIDLLNQVKGLPKYWRLDVDPVAGHGRLTGCIQDDGHPATRAGTQESRAATRRFTWLADDLTALFPESVDGRAQPLRLVAVDSMGVVFELPGGAGIIMKSV